MYQEILANVDEKEEDTFGCLVDPADLLFPEDPLILGNHGLEVSLQHEVDIGISDYDPRIDNSLSMILNVWDNVKEPFDFSIVIIVIVREYDHHN